MELNRECLFEVKILTIQFCYTYTADQAFQTISWLKNSTLVSKMMFLPGTNLKNETLTTDFSVAFPEIDVPIYFISGKYDLTVNVDLSKDYYNRLHAPLKGFYTFGNSAHGPLFEEPERFREILEKNVLQLNINLAD